MDDLRADECNPLCTGMGEPRFGQGPLSNTIVDGYPPAAIPPILQLPMPAA
jgi:hypothetical protein